MNITPRNPYRATVNRAASDLTRPRCHRARPRVEALEARSLLASGPLDASFGGGGIARTELNNTDYGQDVAIQADGKIVVAGSAAGISAFGLARYRPDGSLDPNFGKGGKVVTKFTGSTSAQALALQADGRILVAGYTPSGFAVVRYTAAGQLDTTFASRGTATIAFGPDTQVRALDMAIQADGRIVVVGGTSTAASRDLALARLNPDGVLDATFGVGGIVRTDVAGAYQEARAVAIQADGRIVVAGPHRPDSRYIGEGTRWVVARYDPDGRLDTSFAAGGVLVEQIGPGTQEANDLALQADGKILVAGWDGWSVTEGFAALRLNPDGSRDDGSAADATPGDGYGVAGIARANLTESADHAYAGALQADGKLVVAGAVAEGSGTSLAGFGVARFTTDGRLDAEFHGTGMVTTSLARGQAFGVAIQPSDGRVVVAGHSHNGRNLDFTTARYLAHSPAGSFRHSDAEAPRLEPAASQAISIPLSAPNSRTSAARAVPPSRRGASRPGMTTSPPPGRRSVPTRAPGVARGVITETSDEPRSAPVALRVLRPARWSA